MNAPQPSVAEIIARAKAKIAERTATKTAKEDLRVATLTQALHLQTAEKLTTHAPKVDLPWPLNEEQQQAVDYMYFGRSFCLIGSAGTGKTSTVKAGVKTLQETQRLPMLANSTQRLIAGTPGVVFISYTRRAVRQIARQVPSDLKSHCMTFHALVEYAPEYYSVEQENPETHEMETVEKMRFAPTYGKHNKLPMGLKYIFVDEASMLSVDYFQELWDALPHPEECVFIFIGDLNQLPPVYGIPILGKKLTELPIIELTKVYRTALESPILSLALAVKNNNFDDFKQDCKSGFFNVTLPEGHDIRLFDPKMLPKGKTVIERPGKGKVTLHVWKKKLEWEDGLDASCGQLNAMIKAGEYDPDEDIVLCPWDVKFGCVEMNNVIAQVLGKQRDATIYEVIAGYRKHYLAAGDRVMLGKQEAIILDISLNPKYLGQSPQKPSKEMNRWGVGGSGKVNFFDEEISEEQIQMMLDASADVQDRTRAASHVMKVRWLDSWLEESISESALFNGDGKSSIFAYAMTIHKSQGSEYRRVIFVSSHVHAAMMSRELVYTGDTRAAQELYFILEQPTLAKAARSPRIKGDTLADKIAFFKSRLEEKGQLELVEAEGASNDDNEE